MRFREVEKVLRQNGYILVRKGKHYQYKNKDNPKLASVPYHKNVSDGVIDNLENGTGLSFKKR